MIKQLISKKINLKFNFLHKKFNGNEFKLLDIGAGNHSASRIKAIFPNCKYYGLDINTDYFNAEEDFRLMEHFYEIDLTRLDYKEIPDNYFDGILMTHVIEHLHNGDKVLELLLKKLKKNGWMYLEYPGQKSTKLPSMHGTLNFYDDPTHVRIYTIEELKEVAENNNCKVKRSGTRRNYYYIAAMPVRIIQSLVKSKKLNGNIFWDVLGFAEFLEIQKES